LGGGWYPRRAVRVQIFFQRFPEASVNFQNLPEEAQARAQKLSPGLGENAAATKSHNCFRGGRQRKVYLERQLGLQQANKLMSSELISGSGTCVSSSRNK